MNDLSVLIPARKEQFLNRTVEDILAHSEMNTEIIVVLDGAWPETPLPQHPKVQVVYLPESIGQRAATNVAARLSTAKYVCKADAHIAVDQGWDRVLVEAGEKLGPLTTIIPAQRNLMVYNRVCPCGKVEYQGSMKHPCVLCGKTEWTQEIIWKPRGGTTTKSWSFTSEPKFQYGGVPDQPEEDGIHDVMSSLGACFFMRRERYEQIGGLDEGHGSWGNVGVEIAAKSWLSGGRHVCCTKTWFAHFFRVGGIGFPYEIHGSDQDKAREYSRRLWLENRWPGQVRPLSWLLEKFAPVRGWDDDALARVDEAGKAFTHHRPTQLSKGLVYYSDCLPDPAILDAVRRRLLMVAGDLPIVSVTLQPVSDFGRNIHLPLERGYLTMFRQILAGLEALDTDVAYLVEHDLLYHEDHFAFTPQRADTYYYNQHVYKVDAATGRALHYRCSQTSGLCANRELLIEHYRKRVAHVEQHGYSRRNGFEPGTRKIRHGGFDDVDVVTWMAERPNIDIRHSKCLTPSRWRKDQFRDQKYTEGWTESDGVPGWQGTTRGRFWEFLQEHTGETQQAVA